MALSEQAFHVKKGLKVSGEISIVDTNAIELAGIDGDGSFTQSSIKIIRTSSVQTGSTGCLFIGDVGNTTNTGINNTFIGKDAGANNTTGINNFYIGFESGKLGTDANNNICIGYRAGKNNITGVNNVYIGTQSGISCTGIGNTAIGASTLLSSLAVNAETVIGFEAGRLITTGSQNTLIGYRAGNSLTTTADNVMIGMAAGSGNTGATNVFVGSGTGQSCTTGSNNTFLGYQSSYNLTTANTCTFIGYQTGKQSSSGGSNSGSVFIGYQVGLNNTRSNTLLIGNSSTTTPLVYGEFDNSFLRVNGSLEVTGDLTIQGDTVTVNTQTIEVEDNIIELNIGLSGSPAPDFLISGIKVNRGSEDPYYFLFRESDETFRIGLVSSSEESISGSNDTQPVATRNEEYLMTDGDLAVWNGTEKRFDTISINDSISGSDAVIINPSSSTRNVIQPTDATVIPLTVKGATSQSDNLQEWHNSNGDVLSSISNIGGMGIGIQSNPTLAKLNVVLDDDDGPGTMKILQLSYSTSSVPSIKLTVDSTGNLVAKGTITTPTGVNGGFLIDGGWGYLKGNTTLINGGGNILNSIKSMGYQVGSGYSHQFISGVNPQFVQIYNTYTNSSNYERGVIDWQTEANVLRIGTEAAGTGTVRDIRIVGGDVLVDNNLTVTGDLTVNGTTTTINTETVLVEDNIIELNSSLSGSPPAFLNSGIKVNRGTEDPYYFMWREADDTFRIGINSVVEISGAALSGTGDDTQAVATREDSPLANGIAIWNDTEKRFDAVVANAAISGAVNGTINYIPKFTGIGQLGNSIITDGGTGFVQINGDLDFDSASRDIKFGGVTIFSVHGAVTGTNRSGVAIGRNAVGSQGSIAIGRDANASANEGIAIGFASAAGGIGVAIGPRNTSASASYGIAIGDYASANYSNCIAIGQNMDTTAVNQCVIGGALTPINDFYLSQGVTAALGASPGTVTIHATGTTTISGDGRSIAIQGGAPADAFGSYGSLKLQPNGGNVIVGNNLTVSGNLTVHGTTVTVNTETVLIEDNIIELNSSLSGAPLDFLNAGIKVNRGTEDPYYFMWREVDETFRIGNNTTLEPGLSGIGDFTQAVATREDEPIGNGVAIWNDTAKRFDTQETVEQWVLAPTTAGDTGIKGQIAYDSNYIYICIATDTWVRHAVETSW